MSRHWQSAATSGQLINNIYQLDKYFFNLSVEAICAVYFSANRHNRRTNGSLLIAWQTLWHFFWTTMYFNILFVVLLSPDLYDGIYLWLLYCDSSLCVSVLLCYCVLWSKGWITTSSYRGPRRAYKSWSRKHVDGQMKKVDGRAVCLVCDRGEALYKLSKWGLGQSPDRTRF